MNTIAAQIEKSVLLMELRKFDRAETILQEYFHEAEQHLEIAYYLCWCKICLGKTEEALSLNDFLLQRMEVDADILRLRYTILLDRGQLQEAEKTIRHATELSPEEAEHWKNLSYLFLQKGGRDKCIQYASQALSLDPEQIEASCYLALALSMKGEIEEARKRIKECLKKSPHDAMVFAYAGWVNISSHEVMNDYEAARRFFLKALAIDPNYVLAEEGLSHTFTPSHPLPNQLIFGFFVFFTFGLFAQLMFLRDWMWIWGWIDLLILAIGIGLCRWAYKHYNKKG